jgi:two-component system nitrate/nitrite response regulator NarL
VTLQSNTGPAHGLDRLTPRERDVVASVVQGCSNREIATRLGISVQTVKNHLTSAFMKLAVRSRLQLVLRLVEEQRQ